MATITLKDTPQAQYGRNENGYMAGRQQWVEQAAANDPEQQGMLYGEQEANRQAYDPKARGPGATEDFNQATQEASGAGGNQQGAIGLARSMAYGNSPSAAAYQLQAGLDLSSGMQTSMARGARGMAGIAGAESNAQANTANLQQNAYSNAGLLRSQEMATGRGLYATSTGQAREQSQARLGMANEMGQFNARQGQQTALGMGQIANQFGEAGLQGSGQDLNNYNAGMGIVDAQTQADQQRQSWRAMNQKTKVANNSEED